MAAYCGSIVGKRLLQKALSVKTFQPCAYFYGRSQIGKREVVGYGYNGTYSYVDRVDYPMPAIRFQEDTPEVTRLREKEKGDWKKLTLQEKKTLYRTSFRQTFAEQKATLGDWKRIVGAVSIAMGIVVWMALGLRKYVYPPLPKSMTPENQQKMLMLALDLHVDPIDGLSSKYDYENKRWKK